MARPATLLLQHIRKLAAAQATERLTDRELLERFAQQQDETAFTALLRRHGPMVLRVCQRLLPQSADVEDVFQATFLLLVRKVNGLRRQESVGNWLYGVAYRLALKARRTAVRRRAYEGRARTQSPADPLAEITLREAQTLFDEALNQLPEKFRAPLVLCYLEGLTQEEAARQLGCSLSTLKRYLESGRERLRKRLACHRLTLTSALLAAVLSPSVAYGALGRELTRATVKAVLACAGKIAITGVVSVRVVALVEGGLKSMFTAKPVATALVLALGMVATGAGLILLQNSATAPEKNLGQQLDPVAKRTGQPKPEEAKSSRTDPYSDPLPPGARVRMGTVRLRQPHPHVLFSSDGKTLTSAGADNTVRTWDVATGKYLGGQRLEGTQELDGSAITLAPDGKALVAWSSSRKSLLACTLPTGKKLASITVADAQPLYRVALAPGGKTLAVAAGGAGNKHFIRLWDVATGAARQLLEHERYDEDLAFSPDGKLLGAVSPNDSALRLWDVETGKMLHTLTVEANSLIFSPDSKVVVSGTTEATVKVWDVATEKELATLKATPAHDIQCLAFSADGKVLAVGGQHGLRLWDLAGRKELRQLADRMVYELAFAPDGKVLAASGGSNIRLWDVTTGEQLLRRPGHNDEVDAIAVSSDGKVLVSTSYSDGTICFWDADSGKLLHQPAGRDIAGRPARLSADGKLAASGGHDGALHLWEISTGKEWRRFPIEELDPEEGVRPWVDFLGLSADSKRLVAVTRSGGSFRCQINIWDTTTGKLLKRRRFEGDAFSYFTPDANGVTVQTPKGLAIHETATGRELVTIPGVTDFWPISFSPDGRLLAITDRKGGAAVKTVRVAEVVTGKEVLHIETGAVYSLAFSPDGRRLAASDYRVVRVWEMPTGKEILRRRGHDTLPGVPAQADVTGVAFFPDGRQLATGMRDGTILVWDPEPETMAAKEVSREELEGLWADLANDDAGKGYRAISIFAASPAQAITYLKDHLQPVGEIELKRVQRRIADLDNEQFQVRQAAAKELAALAWAFEPALRRTLEEKPSPELRRRLEAILAAPQQVPPVSTLRTLRSIQILERIGRSS